MSGPVLSARGLVRHYSTPAGRVEALRGVDLDVEPGALLGVVGESGSGKSTLARLLLRLEPPTAGTVRWFGEDVTHANDRALRPLRRRIQPVFQDPYSSLNPRLTVGAALAEPLAVFGIVPRAELGAEVGRLLDLVGLPRSAEKKLPHEFSGGQRQRIAIARALTVRPEVLIADEPLSALDVSVQAQIVNLLTSLRAALRLTVVLVSHDLEVVHRIADRVLVLYLGRVAEWIPGERLLDGARHPYTEALLAARPATHPGERRTRPRALGEPPSPIAPPPGCAYAGRCPLAEPECRTTADRLVDLAPGHAVACRVRAPG